MDKNFFNRKPVSELAEKRRIKLIERLNTELKLEISLDAKIKSQGANRLWLGSGRYKWTFEHENARVSCIGSCQSVVNLLKANKLEMISSREIMGDNFGLK